MAYFIYLLVQSDADEIPRKRSKKVIYGGYGGQVSQKLNHKLNNVILINFYTLYKTSPVFHFIPPLRLLIHFTIRPAN